MTVSSQRAQTLIEVVIAMAIVVLILGTVASVAYAVNDRSQSWHERVTAASAGFSLAAAIQADAHRYVPCVAGTALAELTFCLPTTICAGSTVPSVTYLVEKSPGGPFLVKRRPAAGDTTTLLARVRGSGDVAPSFRVERTPSGISGVIHVYGLRGPAPPAGWSATDPVPGDLNVAYRAPGLPC